MCSLYPSENISMPNRGYGIILLPLSFGIMSCASYNCAAITKASIVRENCYLRSSGIHVCGPGIHVSESGIHVSESVCMDPGSIHVDLQLLYAEPELAWIPDPRSVEPRFTQRGTGPCQEKHTFCIPITAGDPSPLQLPFPPMADAVFLYLLAALSAILAILSILPFSPCHAQ
jgi:hypothetical protein